jgi:2-keto-4-pentenoate hydratase
MSMVDASALAQELLTAYSTCETIPVPPSSRDAGFDLAAAYAVQAELTRLRRASGWTTVGRKVGYANKALWRAFKLDTLVWAPMYDRTVQYAADGRASLSIAGMCSPKIEPEIVVKLHKQITSGEADSALDAIEWLAIGFEIIDCVFADWKFHPVDFVAGFGLHAALVVGEPRPVRPELIARLVEQLAQFKVRLLEGGRLVEEGSGKNALRSPALCVAELAAATARQPGAEPLAAGELISTGTLTASHPLSSGEQWRVEVEGLDLPALTLHVG